MYHLSAFSIRRIIIEQRNIATEMGRVLAKLHKAFKKCETQDEFWNNSLLKEMKDWIKDVFAKNNWKYIEEDKFNDTAEILEKLYDKLQIWIVTILLV